jgi:DNA polymerase III alpha subunit (gram-positive type)
MISKIFENKKYPRTLQTSKYFDPAYVISQNRKLLAKHVQKSKKAPPSDVWSIFKPNIPEPQKDRVLVLSFDLETTGLSKRWARIIQIGCCGVVWSNKQKKFEHHPNMVFETFVCSIKKVPKKVTELTHITSENLVGAPSFQQATEAWAKQVELWLKKTSTETVVLIGHNIIPFDVPMLVTSLYRANIDPFFFFHNRLKVTKAMDTLKLAKQIDIKSSWHLPKTPTGRISYQLGGLHKSLCGRDLLNAHSALADAQGVVDVLIKINEKLPHWQKQKYKIIINRLFIQNIQKKYCSNK